MSHEIWLPKIMFENAQKIETIKGFGFKDSLEFNINGQSGLLRKEILQVKFPCPFQFESYPFDKHECKLGFYEFQYTKTQKPMIGLNRVKFLTFKSETTKKENTPIMVNSTILQYLIQASIDAKYLTNKYKGSKNVTDNYASIEFNLKRKSIGLLLGSFYLPTGTFAILSIGSHIIDPDIVIITKNWSKTRVPKMFF